MANDGDTPDVSGYILGRKSLEEFRCTLAALAREYAEVWRLKEAALSELGKCREENAELRRRAAAAETNATDEQS